MIGQGADKSDFVTMEKFNDGTIHSVFLAKLGNKVRINNRINSQLFAFILFIE